MIRDIGLAIDLTAFAAPGRPIALQPDWPAIGVLVVAVIGAAAVAS
ncbi:MAG: hypothetical protein U0232_03550 [Thermomicrobiales bacterium]